MWQKIRKTKIHKIKLQEFKQMGRPKNTPIDKPLLTAQEAESMANDLENLKDMAGAGEMKDSGYSATAQIDDICIDKEAIRRKIDVLSRQLESHNSQKVVDGVKRRALESRRKELEDKFVPYLETYRDLAVVKRDSMDWHPAYKKALERPRVEHFIGEWKRIGLMLEPQDPLINSLDRLRKES
jgi:hypothetical protein